MSSKSSMLQILDLLLKLSDGDTGGAEIIFNQIAGDIDSGEVNWRALDTSTYLVAKADDLPDLEGLLA